MKIPDPKNINNRTLYHGDNLDFLRATNSESINLIATDPPFNKGRDFHATPHSLMKDASFQDRWNWEKDVHQSWIDKLVDDFPKVYNVIMGSRLSYGDDMGAFLCFMAVRLLEMRRVLKNDGSIYLHCDPTASHYLKELMDAIFGRDRFKNEIVWERLKGGKHDAGQLGRNSDRILFYTKTNDYHFEPPRLSQHKPETLSWYNKVDEHGRYVSRPLTAQGETRGDSGQEWRGRKPTGHWTVPGILEERYKQKTGKNLIGTVRERLDILADHGFIDFSSSGLPSWRRYLHEASFPRIHDIWDDDEVKPIGRTSKERTSKGWPTQKPVSLYSRIIESSSREGDVVADYFCGCATTLVAAENLKRHWIGCDIWENAAEVVAEQLRKLCEEKLFGGRVIYTSNLPTRTDDGKEAVPEFKTPTRTQTIESKPKESRSEMLVKLLHWQRELTGSEYAKCPGCLREFDDDLYFHLDHIEPRSLGGSNAIDNRMPLCGPCNMIKKDDATMKLLWMRNQKRGRLKGSLGEAMDFLRQQREKQRKETTKQ